MKSIFVIVGTIIGAGFASGQEIQIFFNTYGNMGLLGLAISCLLSGVLIYRVFHIMIYLHMQNY